MWHRQSVRLQRLTRRIFRRADPPERFARGLAAGFFAAAIPLPGLQFLLSLLCAWIARGNKVVALVPPFISNGITMPVFAYLQFRLGTYLWPAPAGDIEAALNALSHAAQAADWFAPAQAIAASWGAFRSLGAATLGPLAVGVLLTGLIGALTSYVLGVVVLTALHLRRLKRLAARGVNLRPPRAALNVPRLEGPYDEQAAVKQYAGKRPKFVHADSARLLVDGREAYPEMLAAIARARQTIDMETYILRADHTGQRFSAALQQAARRGVKVRLLYDGVGAMGLPQAFVDGLLKARVTVGVYRPLFSAWWRGLGPMNRRDHRKIMIVDNCIGFIGGLNIADDYAALEEGGAGWRDTHARLTGVATARKLTRLFNEVWPRAEIRTPPAGLNPTPVSKGGPAPPTPPPVLNDLETSRHVAVRILGNKEFLQRWRLRRAYMRAIRHARHYILIENAYFIPDRGIRRALRRAVKRGVVVAVVVALHSDVKIATMASRALYGELLAGGVRLFEYPLCMLHSKIAVIDDTWSMVGSYNLDHRSLVHDLEAGVMLVDRPFAQALRQQITSDIAQCQEVTREIHLARSWDAALLESLAYQLRYWL